MHTPRPTLLAIGLLFVTAAWVGCADHELRTVEQRAPQAEAQAESEAPLVTETSASPSEASLSTTEPRRPALAGLVLDHQRKPVAAARVYAVSAAHGFMFYDSPTNVQVISGESDRFLLFFRKARNLSKGESRTDAEGRFAIPKLKKGPFHILAVHPERGVAVAGHVDQPNLDEPVEIVLNPPTFVEGTLRGMPGTGLMTHSRLSSTEQMPWQQLAIDEGQPLDPRDLVNVWVQPSVNIDKEGVFRVGPLPVGGTWELEVARAVPQRRFSAPLLKWPIVLEPGKTSKVEFDFGAGEKVDGQIVGPEGEALADVAVTLGRSTEGSSPQYGALTDKEGRYSVRGVPAGQYQLTAYRHAVATGFG